ncbi:ATP-dependent dethiobiotin synthetase BioD [Phytophthora cinnamomi]|uniref:ATP-dependent dethiobiotin synthetase BioD n=1 Tax=Phytophthora cinnamomi TaxID=4785 RepID=UPI002A2CAA40|nr:ATP-dependent dethiobiotin synthetase BioD [Phytophthora cinnamomi]KAJ8561896.1 hypothetical protein ON010_g7782 [Phytophthora cinnamomi]
MTMSTTHPDAAFAVLTDAGLLRLITSFQGGLPYLVGQVDASLQGLTKLGSFRGKLPQFAIRRRDQKMLELLLRATQNPNLQKLPQMQFSGVRRCAIECNSLQLLKWLYATRDKSPTLSDERRLLGVAVTSYFDNTELMEWLHSAVDGPHESVQAVTEVEVCRAAGLGNVRAIRWLHEHGSTAFSSLVVDTAAVHGHLEIVQFLHENRSEGCTARAMHGAALNGYHEVVTYLALNQLTRPEERTLAMAASAGHLRCVEALCQLARPPLGSGVWQFAEARQCALKAGHKDVARFLVHQESKHEAGINENRHRWFGLF